MSNGLLDDDFLDELNEFKNKYLGKGAKEQWQDLYGNQPKKDCFSCEPVGTFIEQASALTGEVVDMLLPGLQGIFIAAVEAWVVWNGIKLTWLPKEPVTLFKSLPWVTISAVLLFGQAMLSTTERGLVYQLYTAAESTAGGVSNLILKTSLASSGQDITKSSYDGMVGLAYNAEKSFSAIFKMSDSIMASASTTNWSPFFMGLILIFVFAFVFFSFCTQAVIVIFRLQCAAFFMPFVVMMMAFPAGRDTLKNLFRTLLGAIMVLAAATFAFSLVIHVIQNVDIGVDDLTSLTWTDYRIWVPLTVGVIGGALMFEGVSMANSLVRSAFDNAAAMMGTGAMAAAGSAALFAGNVGRKGLGALAGGMLDPQTQNRVQQIIDKITPKSTPNTRSIPNGYNTLPR